MDISIELSAVATRIEQITGAPVQLPGLPQAAAADGTGSFASMVQAQMAAQPDGSDEAAAPGAPAMVPPAQINALVNDNAQSQDVDPALIKAIIANESGFNANATSNVGAQGLMQLMPATASRFGVSNRYDPIQNIRGGAAYLKFLMDRFGHDVRLALAAYNAGEEAVDRNGGQIPPFSETMAYVPRVLKIYRMLGDPRST